MRDIEIEINRDAEDIGLAELISSLIRENITASQNKRRIFSKLKGDVTIVATDAEVSILLSFDRGRVSIYNGQSHKSDFIIRANSEDIIGLSNIKLLFGYPFLINKGGINILKKLLTKKIELKGVIKNIIFGINLLRIISVN
ncbi:MAG: hypothetical protein ACP5QK_10220 [Myxococcota bacterium]